ncbi:hypothetical protein SNE40_007365 [Patella caerulea]|uniref:Peptidase S1 domain-containing protein n=1 Tax=Patella caerulea TaxID=87958 RepID=A0AAN8K3G3_PATCE
MDIYQLLSFLYISSSVTCLSQIKSNFQRTVIFINANTDLGENAFIRGGRNYHCTGKTGTDPCSIPIRHKNVSSSAATKWSVGDNYLDWQGAEINQASFNGLAAEGTPLVWTTSKHVPGNLTVRDNGFGFSALNTFGSGFWMLDVEMDCSETDSGWFQFKTYITPTSGWEPDIDQTQACGGEVGGRRPFLTNNHQARCGKLNLFYYASAGCIINNIPTSLPTTTPIPAEECGIKHVSQSRIVNGHPAAEGVWPWMTEILYQDNHGCGAVLISSRWAITAGHCVRTAKTYGPWATILRTGETNRHILSGRERDYFIKNIIKHPLFDKAGAGLVNNDHDIALLELVAPVEIRNNDVTAACLPITFPVDEFVDKECWITGWGSTQGTGDRMLLQELKVNVSTVQSCSTYYSAEVSHRQVCAGRYDHQACQGDSGSPLSCFLQGRWYVVGIVSWGDDNCHGRPSVFTRISAFTDWIKQETGVQFNKPGLIG